MNTDAGDWLNFWHDELTAVNYSGKKTFVRDSLEGMPEIVTWRSDSEDLSEYLKIRIMSRDFDPHRYVRLVTNGATYMPIQWFEMVFLPIWIIVTASVGFGVLLTIVIALIVLYRKRKRGMMNNLTRPEEELIAP
jgi:hypothetical protein